MTQTHPARAGRENSPSLDLPNSIQLLNAECPTGLSPTSSRFAMRSFPQSRGALIHNPERRTLLRADAEGRCEPGDAPAYTSPSLLEKTAWQPRALVQARGERRRSNRPIDRPCHRPILVPRRCDGRKGKIVGRETCPSTAASGGRRPSCRTPLSVYGRCAGGCLSVRLHRRGIDDKRLCTAPVVPGGR